MFGWKETTADSSEGAAPGHLVRRRLRPNVVAATTAVARRVRYSVKTEKLLLTLMITGFDPKPTSGAWLGTWANLARRRTQS
jgi:hypothetical protein